MTDVTPAEETIDEVTTPRAPRRGFVVGARVVTGTVGVAVAAVALVVAGLLPLPTYTAEPASVLVTPVPTAQELVCPGGILRLGDVGGQDATTATAIGRATVTSQATNGDVEAEALEAPAGDAAAPQSIRTAPAASTDASPVLLNGAQSEVAATGEFAGLAAAQCGTVTTDAWLVGGSTTVGRTTLLTIANPTDVVATISIEIASENGAIDAPGSTGIIVQPRSQRVIPLAGLAPDIASPVVHVTSQGGQVVASLQQSTVRGLEPGGVDIVGATARPSTSQIIPGIVVRNAEGVQERQGEDGFADLITMLRILAPGDKDTTVTVGLVPDDPELSGASFSYAVEGGVVADLPIEELADGTYTVTATAAVPLVAGVRVSTVAPTPGLSGTRATDLAWLGASTLVTDDTLVSVAQGPSPVLHLYNPTATTAEIGVDSGIGSTSLTVPARTTVTVNLLAGRSYQLSGFDEILGSVSFVGDGQLAGYGVQPQAATSSDVIVYPN